MPPTYSLGAGSVVFEALVGDEWLVADRTWRCSPGRAWTPVPVPGDVACLPLESFDAREHDPGWDLADFDDAAWSDATEITPMHTGGAADPHPPSEPFGMLRPPVRRSFPGGAHHVAMPRRSRTVVGASTMADPVEPGPGGPGDRSGAGCDDGSTDAGSTADSGTVELTLFDLGRIAAGTVELTVTGAAAATVLDVAAAEHVDDDGTAGHARPARRAALRHRRRRDRAVRVARRDRHPLPARWRPADPPGRRHPSVQLAIRDRHRPRPAGASFECSDPQLQRIFDVGLRTVDLCALDAYVDCPTREQRAWTGDSVVHQMVDLVTNPDWSMAVWHPQLAAAPRSDGMLAMAPASDFAADDRTFVPDWSLHWVRSVHHLYRYTGDRELVAELLPVAERTLRWFESYLGADGLLHDVSGWVLLDWSSVYSTGCSSTLNALWARALEDLAEMASWLGNAGTAALGHRSPRGGAVRLRRVLGRAPGCVRRPPRRRRAAAAQRPSTAARRRWPPDWCPPIGSTGSSSGCWTRTG